MSIDTTVILYPEVMFKPRGEVWDWAENVTDYFVYWAEREAPKRTGAMAASIWGAVESFEPMALTMNIGVGEEYASYVVFGTPEGAPGWGIPIIDVDPPGVMMHNDGGPHPGEYFFRYNKTGERNWIGGQDPQNFFAFARYRVQGRYRSIGDWSGMHI